MRTYTRRKKDHIKLITVKLENLINDKLDSIAVLTKALQNSDEPQDMLDKYYGALVQLAVDLEPVSFIIDRDHPEITDWLNELRKDNKG